MRASGASRSVASLAARHRMVDRDDLDRVPRDATRPRAPAALALDRARHADRLAKLGPMAIRAAHADDAAALMSLFCQWGHEQPEEVIAARLDEWNRTPHAAVLVAELEGELAGVAAVSASPHFARPGRTARLAGLVVDAAHRRSGVAKRLVDVVEQHARDWDVIAWRSRRHAIATLRTPSTPLWDTRSFLNARRALSRPCNRPVLESAAAGSACERRQGASSSATCSMYVCPTPKTPASAPAPARAARLDGRRRLPGGPHGPRRPAGRHLLRLGGRNPRGRGRIEPGAWAMSALQTPDRAGGGVLQGRVRLAGGAWARAPAATARVMSAAPASSRSRATSSP